ncbi:MAG: transcriptional regulator GcvA [Acidiferrobacterales bacterium]
MSYRLPPIAALRALEAAARHLNFTKAAEELNVTQSAISHQVRHLEELWGLKLFDRRAGRLALTRNGQALAPVVATFIDKMIGTLETLQSEALRDPLRIDMLESFAVRWLVPRLGHFHEQRPDVDVWISTGDDLVDFKVDDVDAAIRLGHGNYPGLHTILLLREHLFPVCSPSFLRDRGKPSTPKDLLKYPLLLRRQDPRHPSWEYWFERAGVGDVTLTEGTRFPDTNMALLAAIDGQGVAMARSAHVADDLDAGRLVKLFSIPCPSTMAYYLVCPEGREDLPKIAAFREWIGREASLAQAQYDELMQASVN